MNYTRARGEIRSGQLLAWTHRAWGSWYDLQVQAVRVFTRSEYCHVGIACWWGPRLFALEAVQTGVRIFPLSRMLPFYWLPLPVVWTAEAEEWALDQVAQPYSKWQVVLAGLGLLRSGEDSIWQCAEYAQAVLDVAGVKLAGQATPSNLVAEAMRFAPCWSVEGA